MKTRTVCLLSFGGYHFAVASAAKASALVSALNSMEEVIWDHDHEGCYYRTADESQTGEIVLKFNVEIYPRKRLLGLPAPSSESSPDPSNPHRG